MTGYAEYWVIMDLFIHNEELSDSASDSAGSGGSDEGDARLRVEEGSRPGGLQAISTEPEARSRKKENVGVRLTRALQGVKFISCIVPKLALIVCLRCI